MQTSKSKIAGKTTCLSQKFILLGVLGKYTKHMFGVICDVTCT